MELVSLGFGCAVGLAAMFGVPIWLAAEQMDWRWLILSAFLINLFGASLKHRNDILERALAEGNYGRTALWIWVLPWAVVLGIQAGIYAAARAIF